MALSNGKEYIAVDNLGSAREIPNGYAVLEGDDGGTIYATAPVRLIMCSENELQRLLHSLDAIVWPHNEDDTRRIVYEPHDVGDIVAGGMGGGKIGEGVWVHPVLDAHREAVIDIITGKRNTSDVFR